MLPQQLGTFSFVDRITDSEADTRARGSFAIPAALAHFSPCLVAEAVGQLAAWVVMARHDFRRRPLAALAGEAHLLADALPGRILELGVEIEEWDDDAVGYAGWASIGDTPVIQVRNCVGALLPLENFDDPVTARDRFALLRGPGAQPGRFPGVADAGIRLIEREPGRRLRALMNVPESAPFFAEHFPRRPLYPATLLLDAQIRLAIDLAREVDRPAAYVRVRPVRVADVKLRSFILPGQAIETTAEVAAGSSHTVLIALAATVEGKRVATARVEVAAEET
ncbi:MAG TPA: hypothetical protein VMW56_17620 [Candidatus Margulisiibacteriota bacterium]|nr:hypothetical protein [Candidatus Margulisiibacteriota bacterium]